MLLPVPFIRETATAAIGVFVTTGRPAECIVRFGFDRAFSFVFSVSLCNPWSEYSNALCVPQHPYVAVHFVVLPALFLSSFCLFCIYLPLSLLIAFTLRHPSQDAICPLCHTILCFSSLRFSYNSVAVVFSLCFTSPSQRSHEMLILPPSCSHAVFFLRSSICMVFCSVFFFSFQ